MIIKLFRSTDRAVDWLHPKLNYLSSLTASIANREIALRRRCHVVVYFVYSHNDKLIQSTWAADVFPSTFAKSIFRSFNLYVLRQGMRTNSPSTSATSNISNYLAYSTREYPTFHREMRLSGNCLRCSQRFRRH